MKIFLTVQLFIFSIFTGCIIPESNHVEPNYHLLTSLSEDENENELRMILNFGHTVGHAIESFTNYKNLLHGEAIFYGMKCALYLSNKFGNLSNDEYDISIQLLSKFELPKLYIDNRETFINFVKNDKKFREKKIRFILLDEIGKSRISEDITFDQIKESLSVL